MSSDEPTKLSRAQGRAPGFPRLLGGRLCLDFVNSVERPISSSPEDFLRSYEDLTRWSWHAGAIGDGQAATLHRRAEATPAVAAQVFAGALRLRGVLDRVFRSITAGERPAAADLRLLQKEHVEALSAAELAPVADGFAWTWSDDDDLRLPSSLVVESAIELLVDGDLARLKECRGADDCGWLFYDSTRTGNRRWCSMEGCGSRVKMRRHYARRKSNGASRSVAR